MFRRSTPTVVVAGAGPSGLLGALCLAEQGVEVEVVSPTQRDPALRRRSTNGAAFVLHPGSLALLERHAVAGAVLERACRVRRVGIFQGAEWVGELSIERLARAAGLPFEFAASIAQFDLEECLRDALRARRVEVHDQRRLARFEQGAARVRVTIDHLDTDSAGYAVAHSEMVVDRSEELEPEFVLAADGPQSTVRQQLGLALREVGTRERYLIVEGIAGGPASEVAALSLGGGGAGGALWPIAGGRLHGVFRWSSADEDALGLHGARFEPGALHRFDGERLASWLARRTAGMASEQLRELEVRGPFDAEHRLANGFGHGRVWLAGAAAHSASPLASLGVNVGLSEAEQLAAIFAGAKHRESPLGALASYGAERLQRWQRLIEPAPRALDLEALLLGGLDPGALAASPPGLGSRGAERTAPPASASKSGTAPDFDRLLALLALALAQPEARSARPSAR